MFRQRFFPNNGNYNIKNFVNVFTAFFHKFEVFFKLIGKSKVKHALNVYVLSCFIDGFIPFCRKIASHDSSCLLNSCEGFRVKRRIFDIKRAITPINTFSSFCFWFYSVHRVLLGLKYTSFFVIKQSELLFKQQFSILLQDFNYYMI